jgi:hypothetical protein
LQVFLKILPSQRKDQLDFIWQDLGKCMEFHPSQIPVTKTFQIDSDYKAPDIAAEMVRLGFATQKGAFKVIMTKDKNIAKKIGYTIMSELNLGLRKTKQERDVRYWIYSHDADHYAMVLISSKVFESLGF